jgi:hypothetical protein
MLLCAKLTAGQTRTSRTTRDPKRANRGPVIETSCAQ